MAAFHNGAWADPTSPRISEAQESKTRPGKQNGMTVTVGSLEDEASPRIFSSSANSNLSMPWVVLKRNVCTVMVWMFDGFRLVKVFRLKHKRIATIFLITSSSEPKSRYSVLPRDPSDLIKRQCLGICDSLHGKQKLRRIVNSMASCLLP